MREILFRGKRKANGEWVYGLLTKEWGDLHIITDENGLYMIIPETVGQFTGLTDKNGNKIFEGDIIKVETVDTHKNRFFEVAFGEYKDDEDETHVGFFVKGDDGTYAIGQVKAYRGYVEVVDDIYT